jgi:hypothetical protein
LRAWQASALSLQHAQQCALSGGRGELKTKRRGACGMLFARKENRKKKVVAYAAFMFASLFIVQISFSNALTSEERRAANQFLWIKTYQPLLGTCQRLRAAARCNTTSNVLWESYELKLKIWASLVYSDITFHCVQGAEEGAEYFCQEKNFIDNTVLNGNIPAGDYYCGSTASGIDWSPLTGRGNIPLLNHCEENQTAYINETALDNFSKKHGLDDLWSNFKKAESSAMSVFNYCNYMTIKELLISFCESFDHANDDLLVWNFWAFDCLAGFYGACKVQYCQKCRCPSSTAQREREDHHTLKWDWLYAEGVFAIMRNLFSTHALQSSGASWSLSSDAR